MNVRKTQIVLDRLANTSLIYLISMAVLLVVLIGVCPRLLLKGWRKSKQQPKKSRWLGLALSAWFVISFLAFVEVLFALAYDSTDSFSMTNVSRRWFRIHVTPDERIMKFADGSGFVYRDDVEYPKSLPDDSQHVVFLGDSFTFGHGVADVSNRFSNRFRDSLRKDGKNVYVTNLSKPGTDLNWAAAQLEQLFKADHRVDRAVYVMCLNDIEVFHDPQMQNSIKLAHFEPPTFLLRDTYFLNWMYFRVQQVARSDVQDYYSFVKGYYEGEPWRRFLSKLDEMDAQCKQHGTELTVVVFPFLHSLQGTYAFKNIHEQIVGACKKREMNVVDLLKALKQRSQDGLTVNPFDAHPNELAHEIAAKELLKHFEF